MLSLIGIARGSSGVGRRQSGGLQLTLAHPATPTARRVCQALAQQWELGGAGLTVDLIEIDSDDRSNTKADAYDLRYVEWVDMDPYVDVHRLLADPDLQPLTSSYLSAAGERLLKPTTWQEAVAAMQRIARIFHDDALIVPLWELPEYLVHNPQLQGVGQRPVTLYEHVEQWQSPPWIPSE